MDCFVARAPRNDVDRPKHTFAISRHDLPELCLNILPQREGAGDTGCALHPRSRVRLCESDAHEHTGSAETLRHPPRNGFTAYGVISPATNSFLPPPPPV